MTENYYRGLDEALQTIQGYRIGERVYDEVIRHAYSMAYKYVGDPEVVERLDVALGAINVIAVEDYARSGVRQIQGNTSFSPQGMDSGERLTDVALWLPINQKVGSIIERPLAQGCRPLPRLTFAGIMLTNFNDGKVPFGTAYRAVYEAASSANNREDREGLKETAAYALGTVALGEVGQIVEGGWQEIVVEPQIRKGPKAKLCFDPLSRPEVVELPWLTGEPTVVGGVVYPILEDLMPHPDARNDRLDTIS